MTKSTEQHFADWEAYVFGFGYGSGEEHILAALQTFMSVIPGKGTYDFTTLESHQNATIVWLLINILCHHDIIEYGTSPRYGWLTTEGKALREFLLAHSVDDLVSFTSRSEDYIPCYPDICNCGPDGYSSVKLCHNPFWKETT